jgi:hypothetical protein
MMLVLVFMIHVCFHLVEKFKMNYIGEPFKSMWCFYKVMKIDQVIHRMLGLCKYTVCHCGGTFLLFIHSFENVKTVQWYLDLQPAL